MLFLWMCLFLLSFPFPVLLYFFVVDVLWEFSFTEFLGETMGISVFIT